MNNMNVDHRRLLSYVLGVFIALNVVYTGDLTAQLQWSWQNPRPTGLDLHDIVYTGGNAWIAVGLGGTIIRTTDDGVSWSVQESGTRISLYSVSFSDLQHGIAVGDSGWIIRTSDAGTSWTRISTGLTSSLRAVSYNGQNRWVVAGSGGNLLVSSDGGLSWVGHVPDSSAKYMGVAWADVNTAVAVGNDGAIARSTDKGLTWTVSNEWTTSGLFDISFSTTLRGAAVGNYRTLHTSDGGVTWSEHPYSWQFYGVCKVTATVLVTAGSGGTIHRSSDGGLTWTGLERPMYRSLYGIGVSHDGIGIAVGQLGVIVKSTDAGMTWQERGRTTVTEQGLEAVVMINENVGTAVGWGGTILHTSNSGATWDQQYSGTDVFFYDVSYSDSLHGTVVGSSVVLRTTNGGENWAEQSSGLSGNLFAVSFADANSGIAVGRGITMTTDGGTTWTPQFSNDLYGVEMTNVNTAIAVGDFGTIWRTSDAGATWTHPVSGTTEFLYDVSFCNEIVGAIVGGHGTILRTVDGGVTWFSQPSGTDESLLSVSIINERRGAAVGNNGTIIYTTNGGASWNPHLNVKLEGASSYPLDLNGVSLSDPHTGTVVGNRGVILRMEGHIPVFSTSQTSMEFSPTLVGCTSTESVTIRDSNGSPLPLQILSVRSDDPHFSPSISSGIIQPGESLRIDVTFEPSDTSELRADVIFEHLGDTSPDTVRLIGKGNGEPGLGLVIPLNEGWRLVSQPVEVLCARPMMLFSFDGTRGYSRHDTITFGAGYWQNAGGHLFWAGDPVMSARIHVQDRWNIIGSISVPIPVSAITSDTADFVTSSFYEYDGIAYHVADTIKPGHGYWVKARQDGFLILDTSSSVSVGATAKTIRTINSSDLPPAPPWMPSPERGADMADHFTLFQNYPNPFNPTTVIQFDLPKESRVTLKIYDVLGREVATLLDDIRSAGSYKLPWNASAVPSGVYFYRLQSGDVVQTKKLVLLK